MNQLMDVQPMPGDQSLRAIRRALRKEQWAAAEEFAGRALADGVPLGRLKQAFTAAGKPDALVRLLWNCRDAVFKDVGTVASFARLAAGTAAADEYFEKLQQWTADSADRRPTFCHNDYLFTHRDLDPRALFAVFRMKYGTWDFDSSVDALQQAARNADSFHIAPEAAVFFYEHSGGYNNDISSWLQEFRTAQMLHHLFADGLLVKRFRRDLSTGLGRAAKSFCRFASLQEHLDVEEAKRVFQGLDRSRGLLLCTFHGGFLKISSFFFVTSMPDPYWVTNTRADETKRNIIAVHGNERTAAFQTVKALMLGKAVLMSPDGPHHGSSSGATIEVLGLKTTISHGAALIAYEANSDTGWVSAVRKGDMFVPEFVPGPRRQKGEIYSNFRDRWLSFYAEQLNRALSSGPENLIPFARWSAPHAKLWN